MVVLRVLVAQAAAVAVELEIQMRTAIRQLPTQVAGAVVRLKIPLL